MGGSSSKDDSKSTDNSATSTAQQETTSGGVHFLEFHAGTFQLTAGYIIVAAIGAWIIYLLARRCKKRAVARASERAAYFRQPSPWLQGDPWALELGGGRPGEGRRVRFDWDRFQDVTETEAFREDMRAFIRDMARAQAAAGRRGLGREEARRENQRPEAARRLAPDEIRVERAD